MDNSAVKVKVQQFTMASVALSRLVCQAHRSRGAARIYSQNDDEAWNCKLKAEVLWEV